MLGVFKMKFPLGGLDGKQRKTRGDKKIDKSVAMTFSASDAIAHGEPTSTEPPARPTDRRAPRITKEKIERPSEARVANTRVRGDRMDTSKPENRSDRETVQVRQGTGPRAMVSVLFVSLTMMVVAGVALLAYFILR
jgi:hypothetical protein